MKGNRAEVLRDLAKTQYPQSNTYNLPNNSIKSKDDFGFRNEATKDEIKRRVKLSSLLSSYGVRNIKQSSGNGQMICSCPFHADKKPSFSFNDDRSVYNCFSCGAQGDVFALVERMDNTNFKNAFNKLSAMAGINNNISGNTMKNKSNVAIQSPNQNTYIDYNNQEEQKIKAARSALQEMIKSSSNSYQELQNHPYSQKKHLELNVHNGQLSIGNYYYGKKKKTVSAIYVPAFKVGNDDIDTMQFILEDGEKLNHRELTIKGLCYPIGINATEIANCNELILCEGMATAEKIHLSIDKETPVMSCFDKNNIYDVLSEIKNVNSAVKITIAADGDAYNEVKEKLSSAGYFNVYIAQPNLTDVEEAEFRKYQSDLSKQPDFWDLWKVASEERVREELSKEVKIINFKCMNIEDFLRTKIEPKQYIMYPILKESNLIMVYAKRGVGKTFVSLEIAVSIASGSNTFKDKWAVLEARKVLFIDGEMPADTMQKRLSEIIERKEIDFEAENFRIITPDMYKDPMPDLSTESGQKEVEKYIWDAQVIILDNISTLCRTGKENDAESWRPVQEWILSLRKRNIAVVLIHHAGKGGVQRGTSKKEDILDTVINLKQPDDYETGEGAKFIISYEKARGFAGEDAKSFEAKKVDYGWEIKDVEDEEENEIIEYIKLNPKSSIRKISRDLEINYSKVRKTLKRYENDKINK